MSIHQFAFNGPQMISIYEIPVLNIATNIEKKIMRRHLSPGGFVSTLVTEKHTHTPNPKKLQYVNENR